MRQSYNFQLDSHDTDMSITRPHSNVNSKLKMFSSNENFMKVCVLLVHYLLCKKILKNRVTRPEQNLSILSVYQNLWRA